MCKLIGNDTKKSSRHISGDIWLIIIVWNGFFAGDTSCYQNKANPVSHGISSPHGLPSPRNPRIKSRIKYHFGKSSTSMRFLPPPPPRLPTKITHAVPILHMEFVLEGLPYIPPPPPGEVLLWDLFRGKVCHMLHGERLPCGIISGGTICHGICSLIKKFVCGGDLP